VKKGVEKDFKVEWNMVRYMIRGKMFLSVGNNKEGNPIITLKLKPEHGIALRDQYSCIVPGYYSNKVHWNSIDMQGNVPEELLRSLVDEAYQLILGSLSRKTQREIIGTI
jgi:predicted DNA-binding protein (MmcQ/YjbR family)